MNAEQAFRNYVIRASDDNRITFNQYKQLIALAERFSAAIERAHRSMSIPELINTNLSKGYNTVGSYIYDRLSDESGLTPIADAFSDTGLRFWIKTSDDEEVLDGLVYPVTSCNFVNGNVVYFRFNFMIYEAKGEK